VKNFGQYLDLYLEMVKAMELINHRPMKSLEHRTPFEVFFAMPSEVALQI
jgi:IS30 family transposase